METYPHECCGALLGRDGEGSREVIDLLPLANRRDDSPRNRFEVTPDDVRLAEKTARREEAGADRVVSFASRCAGAAERIRPRSRVAVVQLHHRERAEGRAAGYDFVAAARRPRPRTIRKKSKS